MMATKVGHAVGISNYFDVVGLYCMGGYDRIPLAIGRCSCLFWLNVESAGNEYWLVYMLGYMQSKLELEIGSMWDYGLPMQRCWQLLSRSHESYAYDSDWLYLDKLTSRFYKLVFEGVWQ